MADWHFQAPAGLTDFRDPNNWHAQMSRAANDIVVLLVASALKKSPDAVTQEDIDSTAPELAYVNPEISLPPADAVTTNIQPWGGFPRAVLRAAPWQEYAAVAGDEDGSLRAVEHIGQEDYRGILVDNENNILHLPVRDRQDEYLEWSAKRDSDGKISKITFVAEGYDYFSALYKYDEGRALDIYREFTQISTIKVDDLRAKRGIYVRGRDGSRSTIVEPGEFNPRNIYNINPGIVHTRSGCP